MKFPILIAMLVLTALFVAGCQEEPVQPSLTDATLDAATLDDASLDDATAIGMIDAEIAAATHDRLKKGNRNFIGILSGREEVPPTHSRGRGVAIFQVAKDGMSISYKLIVANLKNVVGAQIHLGPAGENGPVVFGLYSDTTAHRRSCGPIARGSFTPADLVGPYAGSEDFSLFLSDLHADSLYVNVATSDGIDSTNGGRGDYNDGEIRGQLEDHRPHGRHDHDKGKKGGHGKSHGKGEGKHDNDGHDGRGGHGG